MADSGGRHSSVDPSDPNILQPRVRIPSAESTLFILNLNRDGKRTTNKYKKDSGEVAIIIRKEAGIGPYLKKSSMAEHL